MNRSHLQKVYVIPFTWKSPVSKTADRERQVWRPMTGVGGEMGKTAKGCRVSLGDDRHILQLTVVMFV